VQVPDPDSRWGFYLADEDGSWNGGFGATVSGPQTGGGEWELVPEAKVPARVRERLGWILDEVRS
jgi:hypothetical protein